MSDKNDEVREAARGALALSDSLSVLRQIIASSSYTSVAKLVRATVSALVSHQDIDGCEVYIGPGATIREIPLAGTRASARMPPELEGWMHEQIFPVMLESSAVQREPTLARRSDEMNGCVLAVPITKKGKTVGSLAVWNCNPNHFLPWHETLLEMVAEVLLLALSCQPTAAPKAGRSEIPVNEATHKVGAGQRPFPIEQHGGRMMDPLTGLPDRQAFDLRLQDLAAIPMPGFRSCFVLYLDIDRFRLIREYGGHMTAERLIRTLAEVLQRTTGNELALGRLGVDEFGVVIERRSLEQALATTNDLIDQVDAFKLTFAGQRYDVSISIGVAQLGTERGSGPGALRRARQACRAAQSLGGGAVQVYHERLNRRRGAGDDGRMLSQLTNALKHGGLELYAQLISPLHTGPTIEAAALPQMHELLLRMPDQNGKTCSAGAFLPIAEHYGLSVKLDRWVIQTAFRQIAGSPFANAAQHRFTLNLSGHSIDNHDLLDFIVQQFNDSGLPPERICFEITETAAISDIAAAKEFIDALRAIDCQFALDDFGSGHSSFLYLRDLPVDYLKIDGELVRDVVNDPVSLAFVRTIEGVGRLMDRRTIAEHVQSREIYDVIDSIGCDYAQGYWIGSPEPFADVLTKGPGQT